MPSLAEFNIGLSFVFDTSAASSNAKVLAQDLTNVRTNTAALVQQFPQLNSAVAETGVGLQTLGQNSQQAGQSIQALDGTIQQNRLEFDGMAQSVSAIGTPLQTLSQQTTEYSGVLTSTGQAVQQFESTSATMESTLSGAASAVQNVGEGFAELGSSVNQVEPSLRQLDSGVTDLQGGLTQTNTLLGTTEQSFTELTGAVRNIQPAFSQASVATNSFRGASFQLGSQLVGLTALGVGLFNNIVNLERVYLRAERAQLFYEKASRAVLVAEKSLDDLIISSNVNTQAVTVSRQELALATQELNDLIAAGILEGEQYEQVQIRVQDALVNMAVSLRDAGIETTTVELAISKLSNSIDNQLVRAQANAIAQDQVFQAQLNTLVTAIGSVFGGVSATADAIKIFSDMNRLAAGHTNILSSALRVLDAAAIKLGISVRTLLIGTGVGIGLIALGFIVEALLPKAHAAGDGLDMMGLAAGSAAGDTDTLSASLENANDKLGKVKEGADLLREAFELLADQSNNVNGSLPTTPEDRDLIAKALEDQNITPVKPDFAPSNIPGTRGFIGPTTGEVPDLTKGTILAPGTKTVTVPPPTSSPSATINAKQLESAANEELSNTTQQLLADKIAEAKAYDANLILYTQTLAKKFPERLVTEEGALAYAKLNNEMISGTIPSYEEYAKRLDEALPKIQAQSHELQTVTPLVTSLTAEQWKLIEAEAEAHNKRLENIEGNALWVEGLFGTVAATQMAGETTTMYETRLERLATIAKGVVQEEDAYVDSLIKTAVELGINVTRQEELHNAMLNGKQGLQDLILSQQTLTDVLTDNSRALDLEREGLTEGRLASIEFHDQIIKQIATDRQYHQDLLLMAEMYGIKLPFGIKITTQHLETLIRAERETGQHAKELAVIHDEAFSKMHESVNSLVEAAVKGGEDWRNAWKDLDKEFIPKKERDDVKDFIEDLADVQQVIQPLDQAIGILHSMADAGVELRDSEIDRWANELREGMRGVKDELNDIHDKNLVANVFDPLIDISKQDLSQSQLIHLANHISAINTALADGTTTQELEDLAAATRAFNVSLIAPGELGSPEVGSLEEFEDVSRAANGGGLTGQIEALKTATEGASTDIETASGEIQTSAGKAQTAIANLAIQGGNSMSILVENVRPHIITLQTYFGTTLVEAIDKATQALLLFKLIMSGGGGSGIENVVFGGQNGADLGSMFFNPPEGATIDEFGRIRANGAVFDKNTASGLGGGGGSGILSGDRNKFLNLPISFNNGSQDPLGALISGFDNSRGGGGGGAGNGFDEMIQQVAEFNTAIQAEFSAMFTAVTQIVTEMNVSIQEQLSALFEAGIGIVAGLNTGIQEEFSALFEAGIGIIAGFNTGIQEELSALFEAGIGIIAGLNSGIQEELSALHEAGIEIVADFNSSVQEEFSALYTFVTEVAEQLVEDVNESFENFVMSEVDISDFEDSLDDAVDAAEQAVDDINDALSEVNSLSEARGGVLSFAQGGLMTLRANNGLIDTAIGPRAVVFGDNPTGIETHAFIPHNDPWPTMTKLLRMFGGSRIGAGGGGGSINLNANINVFTQNGEFLGTARVRKRFAFQNLEAH